MLFGSKRRIEELELKLKSMEEVLKHELEEKNAKTARIAELEEQSKEHADRSVRLLSVVGSTDRRNTGVKSYRGRFVV